MIHEHDMFVWASLREVTRLGLLSSHAKDGAGEGLCFGYEAIYAGTIGHEGTMIATAATSIQNT